MFRRIFGEKTAENYADSIRKAGKALAEADAVVIGAGAGLSTSAGYIYTGERFERYFSDFGSAYGFEDMYSGGFYPYEDPETFWAYWSRYIWINRYAPIPSGLYTELLDLVKDKDYFVITTNVDHCFQRAGFDKKRLFYTQGDYGLFQSSAPSGITAERTYENEEIIRSMILSQGIEISENNELVFPEGKKILMKIPSELVPYCPDDGTPMTTNLRSDELFVEDEGWHKAAERYSDFLRRHDGLKVVYLELGVGGNTPGIIKYPFWRFTAMNSKATYVCINLGEARTAAEIVDRSVCIDGDIAEAVGDLKKSRLQNI